MLCYKQLLYKTWRHVITPWYYCHRSSFIWLLHTHYLLVALLFITSVYCYMIGYDWLHTCLITVFISLIKVRHFSVAYPSCHWAYFMIFVRCYSIIFTSIPTHQIFQTVKAPCRLTNGLWYGQHRTVGHMGIKYLNDDKNITLFTYIQIAYVRQDSPFGCM